MQTTTTEYRREYNKENYKRVQVYIAKNEYEEIEKYLKIINPKIKISGYIKELIQKDIREKKDLLEKSGGGYLESN